MDEMVSMMDDLTLYPLATIAIGKLQLNLLRGFWDGMMAAAFSRAWAGLLIFSNDDIYDDVFYACAF